MNRLAAVLTTLALAAGVAACGDDEESASTTSTATEARGYSTTEHGDEPFTVEATIEEIGLDGTDPVLTAKSTDGETYKVLVPPDVTLDPDASEIFSNPDCAGKVLANLELVPAPDHEEAGDHILVSADIDTESCL